MNDNARGMIALTFALTNAPTSADAGAEDQEEAERNRQHCLHSRGPVCGPRSVPVAPGRPSKRRRVVKIVSWILGLVVLLVAGGALLTDSLTPTERARGQGSVDLLIKNRGRSDETVTVELDAKSAPGPAPQPLTVTTNGAALRLDTGALELEFGQLAGQCHRPGRDHPRHRARTFR